MRKYLTVNLFSLVIPLLIFALFKHLLPFQWLALFIGGVAGLFLADLDHLVYIYFLQPHELTSQRVRALIDANQFKKALSLIYSTFSERSGLIFHTIWFQLVFLVLAIFVFTSSTSLFGIGIVVGFSINLLVSQAIDLLTKSSLSGWMKDISLPLSLEKTHYVLYWVSIVIALALLMLVY